MKSFRPRDVTIGDLHNYLLDAVAPRPIAFVSTIDAEGNPNLSPFSYFNVFSIEPPILIYSPARRVRDNTTKHSLDNVREVPEVVINVVNYALVQQMSLSSTEYPKGVNEFVKAGLTMLKSDLVKPFRVEESPVQIECRVNEVVPMGNSGGAGNLVICEVLKMHLSEGLLTPDGNLDQHRLDLVARAGGNYYTRSKMGFFEIPKPLKTKGIGVDALPDEIKNSKVLTGNDLGMLANVQQLPSAQELKIFRNGIDREIPNDIKMSMEEKYKKAREFLSKNEIEKALKFLMSTL